MVSILFWNVNGLRAINKKTTTNNLEFKNFIYGENVDIVCLNETKLSNTYELFLDEYKYQIHSLSKTLKGYSGVSIFSKIHHIKEHSEFNDIEGRIICLEYDTFVLINVYVPNASANLKRNNFKHTWMQSFMTNLNKLKIKTDKTILIAGDFNCALNDIDVYEPDKKHNTPGFTAIERQDHFNLLNMGFIDPYRNKNPNKKIYTYYNKRSNAYKRNIGWYIDKILIDEKSLDRLTKYTIIDEYGVSDHLPIKIKFD